MNTSDLKTLARWKHIEVIYERMSSGGLNARQRDRLRAELERTLHSFQFADLSGGTSSGSHAGRPVHLPAP